MNRSSRKIAQLICLLLTCSFSQNYTEDSLAVRTILDNNGLSSLSVEEVSGKGVENRIDTLALETKGLTTLQKEIGTLTALQKLYLKENSLTDLPDEFGNLTELIYCDLQSNQLASLPSTIGNCAKLTYFYLQTNKLTALPDEIGTLQECIFLFLDNNELIELPEAIKNLRKIQKLKVSFNQLTALPAGIGDLTSLRGLYCESNKIQSIPSRIGNLTTLDILWIHRNELTQLPKEIGQCADLVSINLSYNKLSNLPDEITDLTPGASGLNIGYNKLDTTNLSNEVITWADTHDPDWKSTQEISGILFQMLPQNPAGISLHYSPIVFRLTFSLQKPADMTAALYDASGRLVQQLLDGFTPAGDHSFFLDREICGSGVCFLRCSSEGVLLTRRILIVE